MKVGWSFPLTLHFTTLYLGKNPNLYFSIWKNVSITSHKIFMYFVEILKLLKLLFEVIVKKIRINYI
jgi:hypothetical protein